MDDIEGKKPDETDKNGGRTITWQDVPSGDGASASITVTVSGTVPESARCGSSLSLSGRWVAEAGAVGSEPSPKATIAVGCP